MTAPPGLYTLKHLPTLILRQSTLAGVLKSSDTEAARVLRPERNAKFFLFKASMAYPVDNRS
jgi:hypothetical protein